MVEQPNNFRVHLIHQLPASRPGRQFNSIEPWLQTRGFQITTSRPCLGEVPPAPDQFDFLIVTGGPMGVDDQAEHPWLSDEKKYLHTVFNSDKPVVGICLGAQLVAQVLGATVSVSPQPERGWWPVILTDDAAGSDLAAVMTGGTTVFHSHADTFATPAGAICLASSEACQNQAFLYEQRVLALQFHLEATQDFIDLVAREPAANVDSPWVQSAEQMLADRQQMIVGNRIMANLLESMMSRFAS